MRSHLRHRFSGLMLTLILSLAVLAGGLVQRNVPNADDMVRLSHALFWGEPVADLCGAPGQPGKAGGGGDCPACTLTATAILPAPTIRLPLIELAYSAAVLIPAATRGHDRIHDPARPVRAPPALA